MSVVVNVCGSNFSIMVSDNRLVRYDAFGNMEIVSEDYRKIHRVNENILIGFTGDAVQCQNVYDEIIKRNTQQLTLEQVKGITKNTLYKYKNDINELGVRIILSGKQLNGKFITYVIDSSNDFDDILYDPKDNMCLIYALPKSIDNTHNYGEIIDSAINDNKFSSSNELVKIIGKAIYDISKLNPGVNNIITYEVMSWMNKSENKDKSIQIICRILDEFEIKVENTSSDEKNSDLSLIEFNNNYMYMM